MAAGYDDMMGLELGGMSALLDAQMIKDAVVASVAGGGALLLGTYALNKLLDQSWVPQFMKDNRKIVKGVSMIALGYIGSSQIYPYNREVSLGVLGGMGAVGVASIINSFLGSNAVSLEGDDDLAASDEALLSNYDGMAALAALEATSVETAPGAFQGFADPTVTPEQLMGFHGTVTQTETLGGYAPYLS